MKEDLHELREEARNAALCQAAMDVIPNAQEQLDALIEGHRRAMAVMSQAMEIISSSIKSLVSGLPMEGTKNLGLQVAEQLRQAEEESAVLGTIYCPKCKKMRKGQPPHGRYSSCSRCGTKVLVK